MIILLKKMEKIMARTVTAHFKNDEKYFANKLGAEFYFTQATGPYEYLLGALSGCFYYTLDSFERKSEWESLDFEIIGVKEENKIPTTLKTTTIYIKAHGVEDRKEFEALVERAKKECSIYNTIDKVSQMFVNIVYEDN